MAQNKMTWVEEIVKALEMLGGDAHYSEVYDYFENKSSRALPQSWQEIIRARIEERSSDSDAYKGKDDLFYLVGAKGSGHWGLRSMKSSKNVVDKSNLPTNNEKQVDDHNIDENKRKTVLEAVDLADPKLPNKSSVTVTRIIRDTKLSKDLKELYKNKCQVCNTAIKLVGRDYSEAHHLQPLGGDHAGPDIIENMIVVCPNHHAEFDYGVIGVNPESLNIIELDGTTHGKLFVSEKHNLSKTYLEYHYNIFRNNT